MPNKSVPQLDAIPSRVVYNDLFHVVRGGIDYKAESAAEVFAAQRITYATAFGLAAASQLIPTASYFITNDGTTGYLLTARTSSQFNIYGTWLRATDLKAFGVVRLAGAVGSISDITVSTIGIVSTGVITLTGTLEQLATDVAANIMATGLASAYAIKDAVVIEALGAGAGDNLATISATFGASVNFSLNLPMDYGVASTVQSLFINYHFDNDQVLYCEDIEQGITFTVTPALITLVGWNPIINFRWGDTGNSALAGQSVFYGCKITASDFSNSSGSGNGCFVYNSHLSGCIIEAAAFNNSLFVGRTLMANSSFTVCNVGSLSNFSNSLFIDCGIARCNFYDFDAHDSIYDTVIVRDGSMAECDWEGALLTNVIMQGFLFANADIFQNITLSDVDISGSVLGGNYSLSLKSPELDGTSGYGLINQPIYLFPIPQYWSPVGMTIIKGNTLTDDGGASAELEVGILGDDTQAMLNSTTIASINSVFRDTNPTSIASADTFIVAVPTNNDIDSGNFIVRVTGQVMQY